MNNEDIKNDVCGGQRAHGTNNEHRPTHTTAIRLDTTGNWLASGVRAAALEWNATATARALCTLPANATAATYFSI